MDEEYAKEILELRNKICFLHHFDYGDSEENDYDDRVDTLSRLYRDVDFTFFMRELSLSSGLYVHFSNIEELVAVKDDSYQSQLIHHRLLYEDFDHNLPDNQNLWKVLWKPDDNTNEEIRRTSSIGFLINSLSALDVESYLFLEACLFKRETFDWYYDIFVNRRIDEAVQIVGNDNEYLEEIIEMLFTPLGYYFPQIYLDKDYQNRRPRSRIFLSDQPLPIRQIYMGGANRRVRVMRVMCQPAQVIRELEKIKLARRWV